MLSVILLLLYLLQRSKLHRLQLQRENLASDKSSLELEIKHKNRELVASSMSQIQSGEILKEVSNRLADAVEHNPSPADEELQQIILKLKQPSSGPFWHEFDRYFVEVGDNFYALLTSRYPNLSPGEVRLCALLKLNLSTKEIASITKKSEHSIKIARYRLRSKLKLTRAVNIHSFLNGL
jgi:DNA-binding CsgD family transcriptional regulator